MRFSSRKALTAAVVALGVSCGRPRQQSTQPSHPVQGDAGLPVRINAVPSASHVEESVPALAVPPSSGPPSNTGTAALHGQTAAPLSSQQQPPSGNAGCVQYEPEPVVLRGVIRRTTFPGPPNYESVADGDAPETYWVLHLEQPICVNASADPFNEARSDVRQLQLVLSSTDDGYQRYRALLGGKVQARGTLFGAHTGHHHTDVLLSVRDLESTTATGR